MQATPKKGRRFGGSSAHQKSMMANLVASLIAAEAITTTEAKAKAMRPIAEKVITKAKVKGKMYYRVAASGYAEASARSLCSLVKKGGGGCIAYASSRPLPGAIDVVAGDMRVAAR